MLSTYLMIGCVLFSCVLLQEQYTFIHDAILESITCGNTQVSAADLQRVVTKLKHRDPHTTLTGYEQQYKVLQCFNYLATLFGFVIFRCWNKSAPELRIKFVIVL